MCVELVTGIAAASGGQCVLLSPTERLQTKVGIVIILVLHVPLLCQYTMWKGARISHLCSSGDVCTCPW